MQNLMPFHLAVPVHDLEKARWFYGTVMGFEEGRSSDHWIDYDFFGHQFDDNNCKIIHSDDSYSAISMSSCGILHSLGALNLSSPGNF